MLQPWVDEIDTLTSFAGFNRSTWNKILGNDITHWSHHNGVKQFDCFLLLFQQDYQQHHIRLQMAKRKKETKTKGRQKVQTLHVIYRFGSK